MKLPMSSNQLVWKKRDLEKASGRGITFSYKVPSQIRRGSQTLCTTHLPITFTPETTSMYDIKIPYMKCLAMIMMLVPLGFW